MKLPTILSIIALTGLTTADYANPSPSHEAHRPSPSGIPLNDGPPYYSAKYNNHGNKWHEKRNPAPSSTPVQISTDNPYLQPGKEIDWPKVHQWNEEHGLPSKRNPSQIPSPPSSSYQAHNPVPSNTPNEHSKDNNNGHPKHGRDINWAKLY